MDNEAGRRAGGLAGNTPSLMLDSNGGYGRAPSGLGGNRGPHRSSRNQDLTPSPPPSGHASPSFMYQGLQHPSNNNVFFPMQSPLPGYPFYPSPQSPSYDYYDKYTPGEIKTAVVMSHGNTNGNGNHYQQNLNPPKSSTFFTRAAPGQFSLDQPGMRTEVSQPARTSGGVLDPMIENLVGSMGNSDGTYSHFGPTGLSFGQINQENINFLGRPTTNSPVIPTEFQIVNTDPFNSTPEWEFQRKMETRIRQKQLQQQQQHAPIPFSENKGTNFPTPTTNGRGREQKHLSSNPVPVPKVKNSTTPPRPESPPEKPSYLEILTKNCQKDKNSPDSKKLGEVRDSLKVNATDDSCPFYQFQNQAHRKFFEGSSAQGSSSPTASNPSTASSSPITKPRAQKGKENAISPGNSNSSSRRNTPVVTPVHQPHDAMGIKKSSANGTTCWIKKLSGRVSSDKSNGKSAGVPATGRGASQFELEAEDPADDEDEETVQKPSTAQSNGEDKNVVSGNNKRKGKRKFSTNGGLGSDVGTSSNNATGSDRRASGCESRTGSSNPLTRRGIIGKSEKLRTRKEGRNCAIRRLRIYSEHWIAHLMKALTWLWTLLVNVTVLSASLGYTLMEDLLIWWKLTALPTFQKNLKLTKHKVNSAWKRIMQPSAKKKEPSTGTPKPETYDEFLSVLGPERNIVLPGTGDEALRRLLSVRGQDPYSILGVRSNSSEETIRRYYKRQAVLVHPDKNLIPGAEEAFKILGKAFEMVGEPEMRLKYHQQLLEAHAKERFIGEFGELFEELRKKMETACSTIRCTKCKGRHKKNKISRPVFAARYCAQCRIHHAGREGELWAEKGGMFSFAWQFYACMGNQVWEINEWGRCQRSSLKHLKPNAHSVIYRLVSSTQQGGKGRPCPPGAGSGPGHPPEEDDLLDPEMEDWDSLINNLYRTSGNATNQFTSTAHKGSSKMSAAGSGPAPNQGNGMNSASAATASAKKRKGKRK